MNRWELSRQQARMQSMCRGAMDDGRCATNCTLGMPFREAMVVHLDWILDSPDGESALVFAFRGNR